MKPGKKNTFNSLKDISIDGEKYKYYCPTCDYVFFCSAYYKKHIEGIKHQQKVKDQNNEINL